MSWADTFTLFLSPNRTAIVASLLTVFLVPLILHWLLTLRGFTGNDHDDTPTFIVMGEVGGGKTRLRCILEEESSSSPKSKAEAIETCTSTSSLRVHCRLRPSATDEKSTDSDSEPAKRFTLLDTPGHPKIRRQAFDHLRSLLSGETGDLKGIVFVVDSTHFGSQDTSAEVISAAEYLHEILLTVQRANLKREVPVLVASNKEDLFTAVPAEQVSERLEEEVVGVRERRVTGLLAAGEDEDDRGEREELVSGGPDGWKWVQEAGVRVEVVGGNMVGMGEGISEWRGWVGKQLE